MSTTSLIILASLVAICALAALWLIQYRQQKAIERARKSVIYTDSMRELHQAAEQAACLIDTKVIEFCAHQLINLADKLNQLGTAKNKIAAQALQAAHQWIDNPALLKQKNDTVISESNATSIRSAMKTLMRHVREAATRRECSVPAANQLIRALRTANLRLSAQFYLQKGDSAAKLNTPRLALLHYRKLKGILVKQKKLPEELKATLSQLDELIQQQQDLQKQQNDNNADKRLEAEFDKLEEQDQDWEKKKQMYDD